MPHRKGLLPSTPAKTAHRYGADLHPHIAMALAAGPNGSADLVTVESLGLFPNQGESETCFAHAPCMATWAALRAAGKTPAYVGSPVTLASLVYAAEQRSDARPGVVLPKLQDTGAELQDVATALGRWGIAPIKAPTPDGRFSDVPNDSDSPDGSFPEADTSQIQVAGSDLITGEYKIPVDSNASLLCAASLDVGIPILLGKLVGSAFQALGPNDVAQPTRATETGKGGHALYLSGYETISTNVRQWKIRNTWGQRWGNNGWVWGSEAWLLDAWELWPFPVGA